MPLNEVCNYGRPVGDVYCVKFGACSKVCGVYKCSIPTERLCGSVLVGDVDGLCADDVIVFVVPDALF